MANIDSAEKRNRQRLRRRARNVYHLTTMRTHIKRVRTAVGDKDESTARSALAEAIRLIDKAAQKGVIKKQSAARQKSRLTLAVNSVSA